jgi:hypothetical protein
MMTHLVHQPMHTFPCFRVANITASFISPHHPVPAFSTMANPTILTDVLRGEPGFFTHLLPGSGYFRVQRNPRHKWGQEVILLKPLKKGTSIHYFGSTTSDHADNDYTYELSNGIFLNPLTNSVKPIAVLFNNDHLNKIRHKAVWEAEQVKWDTIEFVLTHDAHPGDVCCVDYGDGYTLPTDYIDYSQPSKGYTIDVLGNHRDFDLQFDTD